MGLRALPLSSSNSVCSPAILGAAETCPRNRLRCGSFKSRGFSAKLEKNDDKRKEEEEEEEEEKPNDKKSNKQSVFGSVIEALDFSKVRSEEDAQLLDEAREVTQSGGRMTREQYAALRRKIGGTYKDFFKSYVEVDGQYVEEGWVDKTCKICKKDTEGEPRQVDRLGRYVHVACLENSNSGNFFTRLFSR